MTRSIKPELLDELPAGDPRAIKSRRDLQCVNAWMGNTGIMMRQLSTRISGNRPRRLLELGGGDGTFLLRVARRLSWPGTTATLLDQQELVSPVTRQGFAELGWNLEVIRADVFEWLRRASGGPWDVTIANLFLHHFSAQQLTELLSQTARQTGLFVAIDPRRWEWSLFFSRMLWAIGCNHVTRHDALASIRAGFAGRDLSALWPAGPEWQLQEGPANFASHLFVAQCAAALKQSDIDLPGRSACPAPNP